MGLMDRLRATIWPPARPYVDNYWPYVNFGGNTYPLGLNQTLQGNREEPPSGYQSLVEWAYRTNPVVFACMQVRASLFSEARFQWRQVRAGKPGNLFGTAELSVLEKPWPNGTTGDLLAHMIQDVDLLGNAFIARRGDTLVRLRPDWVTIVLGSERDASVEAWDVDAEVVGYIYVPGGPGGRDPVIFQPDQVAHFAPTPDPLATYRGMSWLTSVLREVGADKAATDHKARFFENGATPNMVISLDPAISKAAFDQWVETFRRGHEGVANAYRTLYLGAGAKAEVVGKDFQQMEFKVTQGAGETRIAAAAGVPPVIVGLSEGLQAATYSNYSQARRRFADGTMRPLWRNVCGSLATIVSVPGGAELWYDDHDIAFLQDDQLDRANIQATNSQAIKTLVDAGFEADSVVDAVTAGDLSRLSHTGLFSVQLQPAGSTEPEEEPEEPEEPEEEEEPEELPPGRMVAGYLTAGETAEVRCVSCHKLLAEVASPPYRMTCPRCKAITEAVAEPQRAAGGIPELISIVMALATREQQPPQVIVNSPPVTIAEGAITVTTPDVIVHPPAITMPEITVRMEQSEPAEEQYVYDEEGRLAGTRRLRVIEEGVA